MYRGRFQGMEKKAVRTETLVMVMSERDRKSELAGSVDPKIAWRTLLLADVVSHRTW